jgi:hypothetical protein
MPGLIGDQADTSVYEMRNENTEQAPLDRHTGTGQTDGNSSTHGSLRHAGSQQSLATSSDQGVPVSDYGLPWDGHASTSAVEIRNTNLDAGAPHGSAFNFSVADLHQRLCGSVHSVCNDCFNEALAKALCDKLLSGAEYIAKMRDEDTRTEESMRFIVNTVLNCGGYIERKCSHSGSEGVY